MPNHLSQFRIKQGSKKMTPAPLPGVISVRGIPTSRQCPDTGTPLAIRILSNARIFQQPSHRPRVPGDLGRMADGEPIKPRPSGAAGSLEAFGTA
jgi:hypothetical protein